MGEKNLQTLIHKVCRFLKVSRNDVIRTRDLFVPNEALYQAEPHLDFGTLFVDSFFIISADTAFVNGIFEKNEIFSKAHIPSLEVHRDTVCSASLYAGARGKGVGRFETGKLMCTACALSQRLRQIRAASWRNRARTF